MWDGWDGWMTVLLLSSMSTGTERLSDKLDAIHPTFDQTILLQVNVWIRCLNDFIWAHRSRSSFLLFRLTAALLLAVIGWCTVEKKVLRWIPSETGRAGLWKYQSFFLPNCNGEVKLAIATLPLDCKPCFQSRETPRQQDKLLDVWNIPSHFTYSYGAV